MIVFVITAFLITVFSITVFSITASPMNYISQVLANSAQDDEKLALAALYEYCAAAKAYSIS